MGSNRLRIETLRIDAYTAIMPEVFRQDRIAVAVGVDGEWVFIRLRDGREVRFPWAKNARLAAATDASRKNVELICSGTGIHWPDAGEDLTVLGILEGRFGAVKPRSE